MTSDEIRMWDGEAAAFDEPADHGLRDPAVRSAWRDLLLGVLPAAPARIADLGCDEVQLIPTDSSVDQVHRLADALV